MIVVAGGSLVIEVRCMNEEGVYVSPISMQWTLKDEYDAVVNGRENVALTPASTMYIALNGDDIAYVVGNETRKVLISGTYLSTHGVLNVKKTVRFTVIE